MMCDTITAKPNSITKKAWPWIFVSILVIALDQLTKYLVLKNFTDQIIMPIFPFLNFILRFNAGAAFSFLDNAEGWQIYLLSGISILISIALLTWLCRLSRSAWQTALPISLVLGGALGNLIDRVRFGYVIDFIDFHIHGWHYATFNVADSAVCVGALWIFVRLFYESITR